MQSVSGANSARLALNASGSSVHFVACQYIIHLSKFRSDNMDSTSSSLFLDMDLPSSSPTEDIPVDADLPSFEVLPRRCWVGKIVDMKNVGGSTIASGIVRVHHSVDVPTSQGPLSETHVAVQV